MRTMRSIVHNGGWYNQNGDRVGWGDLSPQDLKKVSEVLDAGEVFVVLREMDAYWDLPSRLGRGRMDDPGKEYLVEYACFAVVKDCIYVVDRDDGKDMGRDGVIIKNLPRDKFKEMLECPRSE